MLTPTRLLSSFITSLLLASVVFSSGCSNAVFHGSVLSSEKDEPQPQAADATTVVLGQNEPPSPVALTCEQSTQTPLEISAGRDGYISLSGDFCPKDVVKPKPKNLFLAVDTSGSMNLNDPIVAGTCGRLEVAKTLVKTLKESQDPALYKIGVVTFTNLATIASPLVAVAALEPLLTTAVFCQNQTTTNYDAALQTIGGLLDPLVPGSEIYLLSDGEPDSIGLTTATRMPGSTVPWETAISSAQALRAIDPALILNVIYLKPGADLANPELLPLKTNLIALSGDASRIALATTAADLVQQLVALQKKTVGRAKGIAISVEADGAETVMAEATVDKVGEDGRISFSTKPFKIYGSPEQPVLNRLTISVNDEAGNNFREQFFLIHRAK